MYEPKKILEFLESHVANPRTHQAAVISTPVGMDYTDLICGLTVSRSVVEVGRPILIIAANAFRQSLLKVRIEKSWSNDDANTKINVKTQKKDWLSYSDSSGSEHIVYITTVRSIRSAVRNSRDNFDDFFSRLSVVIVEECLREKNPDLSNALQRCKTPICIITSNRYWCDIDRYDIDRSNILNISYNDALENNIIKRPEFAYFKNRQNIDEYVKALLRNSRIKGALKRKNKVMIRCNSSEQVVKMTEVLSRHECSVIGFTSRKAELQNGTLMDCVPSPDKISKYDFLVHHNMLVRSYINPELCVLVVHGDLSNDDERVQQVGRILSTSENDGSTPIVLSGDNRIKEAWHKYIKYEKNVNSHEPTFPKQSSDAKFWYFGDKFAEPLDLSNHTTIDPQHNLLYKYSTSIRLVDDNDFRSLIEILCRELTSRDCHMLEKKYETPDLFAAPYACINNSRFLTGINFSELTFEYIVLYKLNGYLFVSTSGRMPDTIRSRTKPIPTATFTRLLSNEAVIKSLTLKNNHLNQRYVRSRSVRANDMSYIAGQLGDTTYSYSTISAKISRESEDVFVERYTGVRDSRVRDEIKEYATLAELVKWFEKLFSELMNNTRELNTVLSRYAQPVIPKEIPKAKHVLLDFDADLFVSEEDSIPPLVVESSGGEVKTDCTFDVEISENNYCLRIVWEEKLQRFQLSYESDDIEVPYVHKNRRDKFLDYINERQNIQVVTSEGHVYADESFWSIENSVNSLKDIAHYIEGIKKLGNIVGEKHTGCSHSGGWEEGTVFSVISNTLLPRELGAGEDVTILCTDLGNEIADFVGYNKNKIIFVHAKAKKKKSFVSASALHDIVSQAIKNLKYLTLANIDRPDTSRWDTDWSVSMKGKKWTAPRRCRGRELKNGEQYWDDMNSVIQDHAAAKEVWIVLGNSLSRSKLLEEFKDGNASPNAIQALTLLSSLVNCCHDLGVYVKIFCSE